ncbi:MAG: ROK family protein, partial [Pseudomonadota bacterium]
MTDSFALQPRPVRRIGNASRILSAIRRSEGIARVDLAQQLDLSPATVTAITARLMNEGLVVERPAAQPTGRGRPRVGLELRPDALLVAGIKLKPGSITTALLDLRGAVIGQKTVSFGKPTIRTDELVNGLMTALQLLLADHGFTTRDLDVVGIGVPGYVDLHTGEHHWSPILRGTPVNVRDLVSQHLDCPLFIDNDANLAT